MNVALSRKDAWIGVDFTNNYELLNTRTLKKPSLAFTRLTNMWITRNNYLLSLFFHFPFLACTKYDSKSRNSLNNVNDTPNCIHFDEILISAISHLPTGWIHAKHKLNKCSIFIVIEHAIDPLAPHIHRAVVGSPGLRIRTFVAARNWRGKNPHQSLSFWQR